MKNTKSKAQNPGRPARDRSKLIKHLASKGLFTLGDAKEIGISQATLSRLVQSQAIIRVARNLYSVPGKALEPQEEEFAVACRFFGNKGVIGGLTALSFYGLTEQIPQQVWVLVPYANKSKNNFYRTIRTKTGLNIGINQERKFRITNIERTIVEAFRYATKIGLENAVKAARVAIARKLTTAAKVMKQARELKLERFVIKHWEAITVGDDLQ